MIWQLNITNTPKHKKVSQYYTYIFSWPTVGVAALDILMSVHPGMQVYYYQIILNFLYAYQYVSWLTSLQKLDKYRDISSSGWYIFLKNFGRIPKMLLYFFHVIVNFQYVYQSISCITFLLLWYNYRYISSSVWKIFLSFFKDILGMLVQKFKIILSFFYVCQCVIWLTSLLKLDT